MYKLSLIVAIAVALLPSYSYHAARSVRARAPQGKIKINYFYPKQLGRGQTQEFTVVGPSSSTIQTVEISPSGGISVGQPKEVEPTDWEKKRGRKRWAIPVSVDKDALLGKRTAVVVALEGRTDSYNIEIVTHVPVLSDLKVIAARSIGAIVDFEFSVFDEAGDLGSKPKVVFEKGEESDGPTPVIARIEAMEAKGSNTSIIRARWGGYSYLNQGYGGGRFSIYIEDKQGNRSNKLGTSFVFR